MVSESMIRTSKKLITIQRMENLSCDSTTTSRDQARATAQPTTPGRRSSARKMKLSEAQASDDSNGGQNQPYSVQPMMPSAARWMAAIDAQRRPCASPPGGR